MRLSLFVLFIFLSASFSNHVYAGNLNGIDDFQIVYSFDEQNACNVEFFTLSKHESDEIKAVFINHGFGSKKRGLSGRYGTNEGIIHIFANSVNVDDTCVTSVQVELYQRLPDLGAPRVIHYVNRDIFEFSKKRFLSELSAIAENLRFAHDLAN